MTKNPFYNALGALSYIILVVSFIHLVGRFLGDLPDNEFLAPVSMLSLLVLSVSVMAYIFFYNPLLFVLEKKPAEATSLFLKTVAIFAGLAGLTFLVMFVVVL